MTLALLAIISGLLQAAGYLVYVKKSLSKELRPNGSTWLMFAYGTATLTILEWDRDASWILLVLPVTCATLSILVAVQCMRRGTLTWRMPVLDRSAFVMDLALTIGYVSTWIAMSRGMLTESHKSGLVLVFLLLTNASTLVSFVPLMKGAIADPHAEHPVPWFIWGFAYGSLGVATLLESGATSEFMVYPAMNSLLHLSVAVIASRRWVR